MTDFSSETRGGLSFWRSSTWNAEGVTHGFIGVTPQFSTENPLQMEVQFQRWLGARALILMKQVHEDSIFLCGAEPPIEPPVADAVVIRRGSLGIGIGVKTADCVPILVKTPTHLAAIHAGWRGLSRGIIERTLSMVSSTEISVLIGPCAGGDRYVVGKEVVEALCASAIYRPAAGGKFYLSLGDTAEHLIRKALREKGDVQRLNICTIADERWHSYRREGEGGGRNIAFIIG